MNETEKKASDFVERTFSKLNKIGEKIGSLFSFVKDHAGLIAQIILVIVTIGIGVFFYGVINGASKKKNKI
jgi:hypothetical protein